jgi:GrpB-like predicted nucleotidyltransferase (UPF0157 family)
MGVYSKLDRPIVVVEYDPRWPALFESERERLSSLLGDRAVDIQHIGSTAIPGLAAKPVIDIAIGFEALSQADRCLLLLKNAGYAYEPNLEAALPDRRFLWRVDPAGQRYHLHLASIYSRLWIDPLVFRDYLRRQPEAVSEYGRLKAALAEACGSDIGAYVDGKADFVEKILILAKAGSPRLAY